MVWIIVFILLVVLLLWVLLGWNSPIKVSRYSVSSSEIPPAFDGFRIVQLSDLHGESLPDLERKIKDQKPDLIVISGDFFDGVQFRERTLKDLKKLLPIAPVIMTSGNHEYYGGDWPELREQVKAMGVIVLEDSCMEFSREGQAITICGLADPREEGPEMTLEKKKVWLDQKLPALKRENSESYRILLFHRPGLVREVLQRSPRDFDLIFSGHLHGGQWRLFNIGIAGPSEKNKYGFFPEFSGGKYQLGPTTLIVSKGLGDQMMLPRINNPRDLVVAELHSSGMDSKK